MRNSTAFFLCGLIALPLAAQKLDECRALRHHGLLPEARACFGRSAGSTDPSIRAEALWGLEQYQEANEQFREALKQHPKSVDIRVRWGRFFLERFNKDEAKGLFEEALEIKENDAGASLGLALVAAQGFSSAAVHFATRATELDPKMAEAHELLSYLALEEDDPERAGKEADAALAINNESLDAMAIHASIDWLNDKTESAWMDRILKINPVYGEAYSTGGHFFVINRRYEDGIRSYRKALDLNPRLWEARSQLGVNLMRLGNEEEAKQQLEQCYEAGYKNAETVNSLRLMDSYKNFSTYKTSATILKLGKKEADLLRPYIEAELERAIATYDKKYQMKLKGPVQLEVYADHEDFAVRTAGLPGLGALGVTFGSVVGMDSPSSRPPGTFHWASTLWHELSHVYVLQATNHRVPRWFTEGMAVYEETAVAPDWGDRLDPEAIMAIQGKKLLPVAQLDRGFIRPSYPAQVVVSYFQAGKICSYIAEKWGYGKLLGMIQSYAKLESTPDAIRENLGMSTEDFDKQFLAWLNAQTKNTVDHFDEWKKQLKTVVADLRAKKYDDVIREGGAIRDYYPDYVETGSVYQLMADAYEAKADKDDARKELEKYSQVGGRSPLLIKRLAKFQQESGDPKKAAATLNRLNYIYPEDQDLHKQLGDLWLAQNNLTGAIREYQAVLATKPVDPAGAHYELANALRKADRVDEARDQVLQSLEAAPGYKSAQRLLLEISK